MQVQVQVQVLVQFVVLLAVGCRNGRLTHQAPVVGKTARHLEGVDEAGVGPR